MERGRQMTYLGRVFLSSTGGWRKLWDVSKIEDYNELASSRKITRGRLV